jgi:pimeloyl-ACP methyl ester carboxylesterase
MDISPNSLALPTQIWHAPDGRAVEWLECGDPAGYPLVFFHSFLGSVRQAYMADALAKKEGLRIISVNRPAVGRSAMHFHGSMMGHAREVLQLLDYLNIREHASCSFSNGAGFALACAAAAPERTKFLVLCSALGPVNMSPFFGELTWNRRLELLVARYLPGFATIVAKIVRLSVLLFPDKALAMLTDSHKISVDANIISERELQREIARSVLDTMYYRHCSRGLIHELGLSFRWGFDPAAVTQPVFMWNGYDDFVTTPKAARALADMLPNARLKFHDGDHVVILNLMPQILHSISAMSRLLPETRYEKKQNEERSKDLPNSIPGFALAH